METMYVKIKTTNTQAVQDWLEETVDASGCPVSYIPLGALVQEAQRLLMESIQEESIDTGEVLALLEALALL